MSKLILPKATTAARSAATPVEGEIFYDKDAKTVFFGDSATVGGVPLTTAAQASAYVYGIDHDTSNSNPATACKKVVLNYLHDSADDPNRYTVVDSFSRLPAHNFKRCVMSDLAERTVAYYLNPTDSSLKADGTAAVLTGGDGDVMVEIPVTYYRVDTYVYDGHTHHVYLVSDTPFVDSKPHPFFYVSPDGKTFRVQYVGAFRAVLCDASGAPVSQVAEGTPAPYTAGCRFRSIAGARAHGNVTRVQYRTGAAANGCTNVNSFFHQFLYMMMAIEGGTFDVQTGISVGYTQLSEFNYAAIRKTGRTASLGNISGEITADETASTGADLDLLTMATGGGSIWANNVTNKVVQFSYRGIEDPYGSQWCFEDGIQKYQNSTEGDTSRSGYWITNDTTKYAIFDTDQGPGQATGRFPDAGYTGPAIIWVQHAFPRTNGYIKTFDAHTFFPLDVSGGSSTTYLCDYLYNTETGGAQAVARGCLANAGTIAGAGTVSLTADLLFSNAHLGGRISA